MIYQKYAERFRYHILKQNAFVFTQNLNFGFFHTKRSQCYLMFSNKLENQCVEVGQHEIEQFIQLAKEKTQFVFRFTLRKQVTCYCKMVNMFWQITIEFEGIKITVNVPKECFEGNIQLPENQLLKAKHEALLHNHEVLQQQHNRLQEKYKDLQSEAERFKTLKKELKKWITDNAK